MEVSKKISYYRIILDQQIVAAFVYINGRLLSVNIVKLIRQYESFLKFQNGR